jgi:hypothetical protein
LVGNKQAFFKGLFDGDSDAVKFEQSGSFLSRVRKLYDPSTLAAAAAAGGNDEIELADHPDVGLDDEVCDPFEDLIEAGDESHDQMQPAVDSSGELPTEAAQAPAEFDSARSLSEPPPRESEHVPLPTMGEVRQLFSRLEVRRDQSGRVVIEAPAEAAQALSALFEGMASLLQAASRTED